MDLPERIKEKVRAFLGLTDNRCALYPNINTEGYGDIQYWENGKKKHYKAHRLVYEMYNNQRLSKEDVVMHSCDMPACCNPLHLTKGTVLDNIHDKVLKNRQAKGEKNGNAKLTEHQAMEILKDEELSISSLSKMYNIDERTVKDIKANKTWGHLH